MSLSPSSSQIAEHGMVSISQTFLYHNMSISPSTKFAKFESLHKFRSSVSSLEVTLDLFVSPLEDIVGSGFTESFPAHDTVNWEKIG